MKHKLASVVIALFAIVWLSQAQAQLWPACQSANSDVDGDGFGWENNQSCIASQQASGCVDYGDYPWGWNEALQLACRLDGVEQSSTVSQAPVVVEPQAVSQPQAVNLAGSLPYPQRTGFDIKSLNTDLWKNKQELKNANISGVLVNLVWSRWQPTLRTNCSSNQIRFEGQCFTIDRAYDEEVKYWSAQGKTVTAVLYGNPSWARDNNSCTATTQATAIFCAARNPDEYARFAAMIATRYNGLNGNGRIADFVIHNEVNLNQWYKVGCGAGIACDTQRWIDDYSRNYNAAYDRITAVQPAAHVMVSFAHLFDTTFDVPARNNPILSAKTFLRGVHARAGGRKWRVAFHPYHKRLDSAEASYDDLPYVTFGNIGVLAGWLRQEFSYQPESWQIHLTENGVSSNGQSNEYSQDIAVCNSYRNVLGTPGIENYVYHRMEDHRLEVAGGAALGLRRENGSAKPVWNTWSKMSGTNGNRNNLDCGFEHLPYTRLTSYMNNQNNHRASTRVVGNGYTAVNDWYLLRESEPNTRMAYECGNGAGSYISTDVNCGGALSYGPVGYVHNSNASGREQLLTCSSGNQIFSRTGSNCGTDQLREVIGYVREDR